MCTLGPANLSAFESSPLRLRQQMVEKMVDLVGLDVRLVPHEPRCLPNLRVLLQCSRQLPSSSTALVVLVLIVSLSLSCVAHHVHRPVIYCTSAATHGMPDNSSHHASTNPSTSTRTQTAPPSQWRTSTRIQHNLIHRDRDASRQNSYELDKLCDALNLTGQVALEVYAVTRGGCANVFRGSWNGQHVAVKVIREYAGSASVETLKKVSHFLNYVAEGCAVREGHGCITRDYP